MNATEQILFAALNKIRQVGYDSKITKAKDTVLQHIVIAEDAILRAEKAEAEAREAESHLRRPACITIWAWTSRCYRDKSLWHNCILAAVNAGASDPIDTARKMYVRHGGEIRERQGCKEQGSNAAELFARGQKILREKEAR